jgi:hypothetical protein
MLVEMIMIAAEKNRHNMVATTLTTSHGDPRLLRWLVCSMGPAGPRTWPVGTSGAPVHWFSTGIAAAASTDAVEAAAAAGVAAVALAADGSSNNPSFGGTSASVTG